MIVAVQMMAGTACFDMQITVGASFWKKKPPISLRRSFLRRTPASSAASLPSSRAR